MALGRPRVACFLSKTRFVGTDLIRPGLYLQRRLSAISEAQVHDRRNSFGRWLPSTLKVMTTYPVREIYAGIALVPGLSNSNPALLSNGLGGGRPSCFRVSTSSCNASPRTVSRSLSGGLRLDLTLRECSWLILGGRPRSIEKCRTISLRRSTSFRLGEPRS